MFGGVMLLKRLYSPQLSRMMSTVSNSRREFFVWVDLEMTGLDLAVHKIIEAACILTTPDLNIIHEGLHVVIHQPKNVFENECAEWCKIQHAKTGLIDESLKSEISVNEADKMIFEYIKKYTDYTGNSERYYLAGNSVHWDMRFIEKYMPLSFSLLHYRIIDISSVKTLCSHWYGRSSYFEKEGEIHRALPDIRNSIEELKYYRKKFFLSSS